MPCITCSHDLRALPLGQRPSGSRRRKLSTKGQVRHWTCISSGQGLRGPCWAQPSAHCPADTCSCPPKHGGTAVSCRPRLLSALTAWAASMFSLRVTASAPGRSSYRGWDRRVGSPRQRTPAACLTLGVPGVGQDWPTSPRAERAEQRLRGGPLRSGPPSLSLAWWRLRRLG